MQEEIKPKKIKKILKPSKIEERETYYSEDEVEIVVDLPDREDTIRVPIRKIKGTLNLLRERKEKLQEELDAVQEEITLNKKWLEEVKPELAKIKYFKFEE